MRTSEAIGATAGDVGAVGARPCLRVCIVTTFYPPYHFGGDAIFAERLAHALAARGHFVRVLHDRTAFSVLARHPPMGAVRRHPNIDVVPLDATGGALGLLWMHQAGTAAPLRSALRRWLDAENYDVIHFNNPSMMGGLEAFRFGRALKLCTLSDHWLVCPRHDLWRFGREACTRPTCAACTLHAGRPPQLWRSVGRLQRACEPVDVFLAPSRATAAEHRRRGLAGDIVHLPLFCDADPLDPQAPSVRRAADRPYFLFAGRLEPEKGVEDLLSVFRQRRDIDLVIAGAGRLGDRLADEARRTPNVRMLGLLDANALAPWYAGAVATIVPSRCFETFGLVVIESFAAGTPVIVRDHSGLAEFIEDHGGGLTFRHESQLAAAVDRLRDEPTTRRQLAEQARQAYTTDYSEERFVERYLALVEARRRR